MPNPSPTRVLVTGSTGQIGSELTIELSGKFGKANVIGADLKEPPGDSLRFESFRYLDVTDRDAIRKLAKEEGIGIVFHLAGILSATGESNPDRTWSVNTSGLRNVLEVAKESGVSKVFWPSSIAVFGTNAPKKDTPQDSPLVPTTMYGLTKVSGELLCNYYYNRFGLDVRSLRYPGIISSETLPGGGTTDYAVEIFYEALKHKRYTCFVRKDTVLPMMYMPDAIRAMIELMDVDRSKLSIHTSYNLAGFSFSVEELALEMKRNIGEFEINYIPDFRQAIADSWPMSIDDSIARRDWGWKPKYDLKEMTRDMIANLSKKFSSAS